MTGRTIVLTGASDGIGAAAARRLAGGGPEVVVVGRSAAKTRAVADEIGAPAHVVDFARLDEVRSLAGTLRAEHPRIDVLANNAGGIMGNRELTVDGFEKTFQVNHLAPFLLTNLLLGTLLASRATVIGTASAAARLFGRMDPDDLQNERSYSPSKAYGDAKLANILFTSELHHRFGAHGLAAAAFHPGVVSTNFAEGSTSPMRLLYRTPLRHLLMVGPAQGADTLVWLAETAPGTHWQSGLYFEKRRPARTNPQAHDAALARTLWERSAEMVGISGMAAPSES